MREYVYGFRQEVLLQRGLNLNEACILDYLVRFFKSGNAQKANIDGEKYYWISYQKISNDLPILNLSERTIRFMIDKLEDKKILFKVVKNQKLYIKLDEEMLYKNDSEICKMELTEEDKKSLEELSTKIAKENELSTINGKELPQICKTVAKKCDISGKKCHPIVSYYRNKIKILINDDSVAYINRGEFLQKFKQAIRLRIGKVAYDICIDKMQVLALEDKFIVLECSTASIMKIQYNKVFCEVLEEVLQDLFDMVD